MVIYFTNYVGKSYFSDQFKKMIKRYEKMYITICVSHEFFSLFHQSVII